MTPKNPSLLQHSLSNTLEEFYYGTSHWHYLKYVIIYQNFHVNFIFQFHFYSFELNQISNSSICCFLFENLWNAGTLYYKKFKTKKHETFHREIVIEYIKLKTVKKNVFLEMLDTKYNLVFSVVELNKQNNKYAE